VTVPAPIPPKPNTKEGQNWLPVGFQGNNCASCKHFGGGGGYPNLGGNFEVVSLCDALVTTDPAPQPEYTTYAAVCDLFAVR